MELDKHEVLRVLLEKGLKYLHHANTAATVNAFFRAEKLISRGAMEDMNLYQTKQVSDGSDKELGIWHDIFFDGSDIHERAGRRNIYGPVLLKFDPTLLLNEAITGVWIAKKNPLYWVKQNTAGNWISQVSEANRWFQSIDELEKAYSPTVFDYHIVVRSMHDGLPITPYLREVVLDNTDQPFNYKSVQNLPWVSTAFGVLWSTRRATLRKDPSFSLGANFNIRQCACQCQEEYRSISAAELFQNFGF